MCEKCNKGKYYITTAIAYASGKPHIGNTYEVVQMQLQDTKEVRDTMYFSRQELTNMVRKLNWKRTRQVLHQNSSLTMQRERLRRSGI